jgi:predicted RND superfamily exporter protein
MPYLAVAINYIILAPSGESEDAELFKNPEMLKRFKDISEFSEQDKEYIIYTLDALIKSVKLKSIA